MADDEDPNDPPSQRHSKTSRESAKGIPRRRLITQEWWVYKSLQKLSKADWELWKIVRVTNIFDQESSVRRARVGLMWVNEDSGTTEWHPVEDSGRTVVNPDSNKSTAIWQIKEKYRGMPYEEWSKKYRNLARRKGGKKEE